MSGIVSVPFAPMRSTSAQGSRPSMRRTSKRCAHSCAPWGKPMQKPDERGYFGAFGGKFAPEVLYQAITELEAAMNDAFADPAFWDEYHAILRDYVGRPSPLYVAERFAPGPATIVFKREDLNHTGAHKINNTVGQALLARRMGKKRLIAETGA